MVLRSNVVTTFLLYPKDVTYPLSAIAMTRVVLGNWAAYQSACRYVAMPPAEAPLIITSLGDTMPL